MNVIIHAFLYFSVYFADFFPPESTQDSMTCNKIKAEFIEFAYSQAYSQQEGLGAGLWVYGFIFLNEYFLLIGLIFLIGIYKQLHIIHTMYVAIPKTPKLYLYTYMYTYIDGLVRHELQF